MKIMSNLKTLFSRNDEFKQHFSDSGLPILPKFRSVILACADARVDPAHIFKLDLGDSVVIRNNGGRVTPAVIEEIASLAFMVAMMDKAQGKLGPFEVVIVHHAQCGVERFADSSFQQALKNQTGVDVSSIAITNHEESLHEDIKRLRDAKEIPDYIIVSGSIYDVKSGSVNEIIKPEALRS